MLLLLLALEELPLGLPSGSNNKRKEAYHTSRSASRIRRAVVFFFKARSEEQIYVK